MSSFAFRKALLAAASSALLMAPLFAPAASARETSTSESSAATSEAPAADDECDRSAEATATVTPDEKNFKITVKGQHFCAEKGYGVSKIAVKFDGGKVKPLVPPVGPEGNSGGIYAWIDPKEDGSFEETWDVPKDLEAKKHKLYMLTGSVKEHDVARSVQPEFSWGEFEEHPYGQAPHFDVREQYRKVVPPELENAIIPVLKDDGATLKVYMPNTTPGEWVGIDFLRSDHQDLNGPNVACNYYSGANYWHGKLHESLEDFNGTYGLYHRVEADHSVTLPIGSKQPVEAGPLYLIAWRNMSPNQDFYVANQPLVGWAFMNNTGTWDNPKLVVGYFDPNDPNREYTADRVANSGGNTEFQCKTYPMSGLASQVAYPAEPVVNGDREIVIPNLPTVEYFIDGQKVTGKVAAKDDAAAEVTVVAKPHEGYRFLVPNSDGTIDQSKSGEISYQVSVPAKANAGSTEGSEGSETTSSATTPVNPGGSETTTTTNPDSSETTSSDSSEASTEASEGSTTTTPNHSDKPDKPGKHSWLSKLFGGDGLFGGALFQAIGIGTFLVLITQWLYRIGLLRF